MLRHYLCLQSTQFFLRSLRPHPHQHSNNSRDNLKVFKIQCVIKGTFFFTFPASHHYVTGNGFMFLQHKYIHCSQLELLERQTKQKTSNQRKVKHLNSILKVLECSQSPASLFFSNVRSTVTGYYF